MNLIELATGAQSSEFKIVLIIVAVLGAQALGIDAAVLLPLILDGGDIVKYEELIKALGSTRVSSGSSTWALAAIGVGYPVARAYIKSLKTKIIREKRCANPNVGGNTLTDN